jgi:hypothetical protein
MAATVDVVISVQAEIAKLRVDDKDLKITAGGATVKAKPGNHALTWAVRGAAGTKYTVKITAPKEAVFSHTDTFDEEQFDAGLKWFKINEVV